MSLSRKQRRANKQNALASTGPRTESGKEISKQNSLQHGLCSQNPVHPSENRTDYEAHKASWIEELRPATFVEHRLTQIIIDADWRLKRIKIIDDRLMSEDHETLELVKGLDKLSRHENRIRKLYTESIEQLVAIRHDRLNRQKQQELTAEQDENGFVLQRLKKLTSGMTPEQAQQVVDAYLRGEIDLEAGETASADAA